jgi:hypothetical protein
MGDVILDRFSVPREAGQDRRTALLRKNCRSERRTRDGNGR